MGDNKGQGIFLSVVGIATLLVAIIGATFAYFSIQVQGNNTASSIHVSTANVGGVTFDGTGAGITIDNAYPGWSETKQFTIRSDADANGSITYEIQLVTTEGELAQAAAPNNHFIYSLSGTASGSGTPVTPAVTNANMPYDEANPVTLGTGTLVNNDTHTYTFTVELVESGSNQNTLQGLTYEGIIQINVSDAQGKRTWDAANSTWKQYGT